MVGRKYSQFLYELIVYMLTSFSKAGSQFSSLFCSSCVLTSTGWLGLVWARVLVVYRPRSMSQA